MTTTTTGPRPKPVYRPFVSVPQGCLGIVVKGETPVRIIHGVDKWEVNDEFSFEEVSKTFPRKRSPWMLSSGREFVGPPFFRAMYVYKFTWNAYKRKDGNSPVYAVSAHEPENIIWTPFENNYPLKFEGVDVTTVDPVTNTKSLTAIGVELTARIRIKKPVRALMENLDWFGGVLMPNMERIIKNIFGPSDYELAVRGGRDVFETQLNEYVIGNGTLSPFSEQMLREIGIEILSVGITNIIPNKEYEKTLEAVTAALQRAKATRIEADANAYAEEQRGKAEAAKINASIAAEEDRIKRTSILAAGGAGPEAARLEGLRLIKDWRPQVLGGDITTMFTPDKKGES